MRRWLLCCRRIVSVLDQRFDGAELSTAFTLDAVDILEIYSEVATDLVLDLGSEPALICAGIP
jgi:hypothetical protein